MSTPDTDDLFAAIATFLSEAHDRPTEPEESTLTFWDGHTSISPSELEILLALRPGPLGATEIAERLERGILWVADMLDALVAKRLVQRQHARYSNTEATEAYLRIISPDR